MTEGKVAIIPSNAMHSELITTDCKIMDIFSGLRRL